MDLLLIAVGIRFVFMFPLHRFCVHTSVIFSFVTMVFCNLN